MAAAEKGKIVVTGGIGQRQREAVKALAVAWTEAEKAMASAVGRARQKCSEAKEAVIERAERMGAKPVAFRAAMKRQKLLAQAEGTGEGFDEDVMQVFDNICLALELPLFKSAGVEAPPKGKPKRASAKSENGKGTDEHRTDAGVAQIKEDAGVSA